MRHVLAVLVLMTTAAAAQEGAAPTRCSPTAAMEAFVHGKYGENPVGAGIAMGGTLFVTTNPETGTFSILLKKHDGMTCLMTSGRGYTTIEAMKNGSNL